MLTKPSLGEDEFSYGYDGRGLKVENGRFEEFGQSFGENDVIGCFAVSAAAGRVMSSAASREAALGRGSEFWGRGSGF